MLSQLKEGNIFRMQAECNAEQQQNRLTNEEILDRIIETLDLFYLQDSLVPIKYLDQDSGKHLIFVRVDENEDKERLSKVRTSLRNFYNNTYLSGKTCINTSNLFCQKNCIRCSSNEDGFKDATVSTLTVQSIIRALTYGNELSTMVLFQHWLHSYN